MFTVTHAERPADPQKGLGAVPAGLIIIDDKLGEQLIAAGVADQRVVVATAKHFVKDRRQPTASYSERQTIGDKDHALRALARGKARLEPALGAGVAIAGVVIGDAVLPLAHFRAAGGAGAARPPAGGGGAGSNIGAPGEGAGDGDGGQGDDAGNDFGD